MEKVFKLRNKKRHEHTHTYRPNGKLNENDEPNKTKKNIKYATKNAKKIVSVRIFGCWLTY